MNKNSIGKVKKKKKKITCFNESDSKVTNKTKTLKKFGFSV